jgi:uncharacterized protein
MQKRIVVRWQGWSGKSIEHTVVRRGSGANSANGVVIAEEGSERFAVRYMIDCEGSWSLRQARLELIGADSAIELRRADNGKWSDGSGRSLPHLDGATDLDLSVTPFTNTLPIQRLRLRAGESAEILTAYVRFPEQTVTTDPQRYTCLEPMRRYRYESLDSDFVREVEVDADGLVLIYPGLFRRLA